MGRPRKHDLGLPVRVYLRHGAYFYVTPEGTWERLCDESVAPAEVPRILADWLKKRASLDMDHLFDLYAARVMSKRATATRRINKPRLQQLRKAFGKHAIQSIKPRDIADRPEQEVELLSNVFSYGIRWRMAKRNPCLRLINNRQLCARISATQFWEAWSDAPKPIALAMELSLRTKQSLGDVLTLPWSAVGKDGLHFSQTRPDQRIRVAWSKELHELIIRCKEISGESTHVLVNSRGRPWSLSGFQTAWHRFMLGRAVWFEFRIIRKLPARYMNTK
ncbi:hypothetical protein OIV40_25340 [Burkholderia pseudomallei]|uniref:hypothetical protein n=1 Tax=Burkholderia pseudomallei TaxID=28450 RepID=UPI0021F6FD12|nr:hypothetical protein [Burkholderia pseudomallei]MCW0116358.1 hypothetical protein [Burkholderia pseudomallei]